MKTLEEIEKLVIGLNEKHWDEYHELQEDQEGWLVDLKSQDMDEDEWDEKYSELIQSQHEEMVDMDERHSHTLMELLEEDLDDIEDSEERYRIFDERREIKNEFYTCK